METQVGHHGVDFLCRPKLEENQVAVFGVDRFVHRLAELGRDHLGERALQPVSLTVDLRAREALRAHLTHVLFERIEILA